MSEPTDGWSNVTLHRLNDAGEHTPADDEIIVSLYTDDLPALRESDITGTFLIGDEPIVARLRKLRGADVK